MIEEVQDATSKRAKSIPVPLAQRLSEVTHTGAARITTGIHELDRVLGGGIVPGSVVLIGGDPGMGKSTLMLQVASRISVKVAQAPCLYITGEESLYQLRQRADRLSVQIDNILVVSETNVERIAALIRDVQPSMVIVDSVQTITTELLESSAGSVAQVRECTAHLTNVAKSSGTPLFIIGHVTKDGAIAGPKVLEHIVDAVLQFEGDGMYSYRVLRALKNRYGSTNELGVFDMRSDGLKEVHNPSEVLLSQRSINESGTAIVAVMEGTRPLLLEVQALVSPTGYSQPQRVSTGYDTKRLQMILAILEKRGGLQVRGSDVFVNVAGGIAIQDPAIDLGVAVAVASSVFDAALPQATAFVGELGLTGEIRRVAYLEQRLTEAARLGLERVYAATDTSVSSSVLSKADKLSSILTELFR